MKDAYDLKECSCERKNARRVDWVEKLERDHDSVQLQDNYTITDILPVVAYCLRYQLLPTELTFFNTMDSLKERSTFSQ